MAVVVVAAGVLQSNNARTRDLCTAGWFVMSVYCM